MSNSIWWGDFAFDLQEQKCWSIGQRAILLKRKATEWNTWNIESVAQEHDDITLSDGANFTVESTDVVGRFLEKSTSDTVKVFPLLADRTVIARPSSPLVILAGEKIQLFISTPIWFCAHTVPSGKCIVDLPFWRPSDSWFGSSTIDGQLCYAKYTSAKTQLEDLDLHSHKATTSIIVVNNHDQPFTINRINVPVNHLHLYSDEQNNLWTSRLTIEIKNDSSDVELIVDKSVSSELAPLTFISSPRVSLGHGKLIRRISNLLG